MSFTEWVSELFQKVVKALTSLYDIILHIIANPIILGMCIYVVCCRIL
jgi:hypothetical protein